MPEPASMEGDGPASPPADPRLVPGQPGLPLAPREDALPLPGQGRVLLVRFGSLGDLVKTTGLPRLIRRRFPNCWLGMLTAAPYRELIADHPSLDAAFGFERRGGLVALRALAADLRAQGVDLYVDLHRSLRSRLLGRMLGLPTVGYSKRSLQRQALIQFGWNTYRPATGKEQDFLSPLAPYGVTDDGQGTEINLNPLTPRMQADPRFGADLEWFAAQRAEGRAVLGLSPIAAWALKRWPLAHVEVFARRFLAESGGAITLFGGPADEEAAALASRLGHRVRSLVGRTSHLESAWFSAQCDLMLTNDTGMLHLSEAVGTDVVAIFGATSRELGYYPTRAGSLAVERPLPCRPCTRMGEGRCDHPRPLACLAGIEPEFVVRVVLNKLAQSRSGAPLGAGRTA